MLVTVTIAGGAMLGPQQDYKKEIESSHILTVDFATNDQVGKSVITMDSGEVLNIRETVAQVKAMTQRSNGVAWLRTFKQRIWG